MSSPSNKMHTRSAGNVEISQRNRDWIKEFKIRNGRPPRVLHIGNIANNAYNNSKLMNQAGLVSDVICYDYFHIMGCPEWEDADFEVGEIDHYNPDWRKVDLNNFERPDWFIQGDILSCLEILRSKWEKPPIDPLIRRGFRFPFYLNIDWFSSIVSFLRDKVLGGFIRIVSFLRDSLLGRWSLPIASLSRLRVLGRNYKSLSIFIRIASFPIGSILVGCIKIASFFRNTFSLSRFASFVSRKYRSFSMTKFSRRFAKEFPSRVDKVTPKDYQDYLYILPHWKNILRHYDFIIGYSTDGILPMFCEVPFFAFEHGTLRDIPDQEDRSGRLTSLAYRLAKHVFVTNFDCVEKAKILAPRRYSLINHPFDEDAAFSIDGVEELRTRLLSDLNCEFLFFHPTRQDWTKGNPMADKQNDIFLEAFVALRKAGIDVGVVCCNWGKDVAATKEFLRAKGCDPYVAWVEPMPLLPFQRMCLASDVMADQFKLGAFGGITFKAMAVGCPIITYLDEEMLLRQYPQCPPVLNCATVEDIIAAVRSLLDQPEKRRKLSADSRSWMKHYHSKAKTLDIQIDQFRLALS